MFFELIILLYLTTSMIELFMLDLVMFMIYLFRNLIMQLPNNSTLIPPSPGWGGALCSQLHTSCVILRQNAYAIQEIKTRITNPVKRLSWDHVSTSSVWSQHMRATDGRPTWTTNQNQTSSPVWLYKASGSTRCPSLSSSTDQDKGKHTGSNPPSKKKKRSHACPILVHNIFPYSVPSIS